MKHFFKNDVSVSSVLFTVATSIELWIGKLAIEKSLSTRFYLRKFEQEKFRFSGRKYKCYAEFLSELFDKKNSVPLVRKDAFVFWRYWVYPRSCRDSCCIYLWP